MLFSNFVVLSISEGLFFPDHFGGCISCIVPHELVDPLPVFRYTVDILDILVLQVYWVQTESR